MVVRLLVWEPQREPLRSILPARQEGARPRESQGAIRKNRVEWGGGGGNEKYGKIVGGNPRNYREGWREIKKGRTEERGERRGGRNRWDPVAGSLHSPL